MPLVCYSGSSNLSRFEARSTVWNGEQGTTACREAEYSGGQRKGKGNYGQVCLLGQVLPVGVRRWKLEDQHVFHVWFNARTLLSSPGSRQAYRSRWSYARSFVKYCERAFTAWKIGAGSGAHAAAQQITAFSTQWAPQQMELGESEPSVRNFGLTMNI